MPDQTTDAPVAASPSPWPHQHQLEPAGFTTPARRDPAGYFLGDTRPLAARIRSAVEALVGTAALVALVVFILRSL